MDGNGCLDGRVNGVNGITEKSVYHAVYDSGLAKGPRVKKMPMLRLSVQCFIHFCIAVVTFLLRARHGSRRGTLPAATLSTGGSSEGRHAECHPAARF